MRTQRFINVIDLEATCSEDGKVRNEIIEIGIAVIDIQKQSIINKEAIIVLPFTQQITDFCTTLTSLTPEYVQQNGVILEKAIQKLRDNYKCNRNVFASWGDFDRKALENNCRWQNVRYPFANLHLNVKSLYSACFGHSGGMKEMAKELGLEFQGTHHRGVDDAFMIAQILLELLYGDINLSEGIK